MTKNSVFKLRNRRAVRLADTCWLSESKGTLKPHSRTCSYLIKQRPSSAACRPSTDTFTRLSAFFTFFCHSLRTSHWLNIQPPPRGSLSPSPSQSRPIKVTSRPYQINTKKKRHLDLLHLAEVRYRTCHGFWLFLKFRIPRTHSWEATIALRAKESVLARYTTTTPGIWTYDPLTSMILLPL